MLARLPWRMTHRGITALNRTKQVAQHMSTTSGVAEVEEVRLFLIDQDSRLIVLIA
jgi:hypothetical protein